jgi:hypothetical protein
MVLKSRYSKEAYQRCLIYQRNYQANYRSNPINAEKDRERKRDWRIKNREVIKVARGLGVGIKEARKLMT